MASVEIVEVCQVAPLTNPSTEFSLPLAFLDLIWLRIPPAMRLFFYQLTEYSTPFLFNSIVLPKLKKSLAAVLAYFPPIAGRLVWPSHSPIPIVQSTPHDGVSLTVAISDEDFDHLSSDETRDSNESYPYIPNLSVSEDEASTLALQITLFPGKGFSIGYAMHHTVLDGKSVSLFMKAWSYICKNTDFAQNSHPVSLPEEHTPVFDRTAIKDPSDFSSSLLKTWDVLTRDNAEFSKNPRSLKLLQPIGVTNIVRSTFVLSRDNINKLRQKVLSQVKIPLQYLSTFVLTCAYTLVCRFKAQDGDSNKTVYFGIPVDCRARLDPPVPANYFGNCLCLKIAEARDYEDISVVAERISNLIKGLENKNLFEGVVKLLLEEMKEQPIWIAGSTRLGMYGIDFGWGRPKKVEIVHIDRIGAIALSESRDGNGGVEIGLALVKHEMEAFASLFANGP